MVDSNIRDPRLCGLALVSNWGQILVKNRSDGSERDKEEEEEIWS